MLRFGEAPYLECSSRGDARFSAFHAEQGHQCQAEVLWRIRNDAHTERVILD